MTLRYELCTRPQTAPNGANDGGNLAQVGSNPQTMQPHPYIVDANDDPNYVYPSNNASGTSCPESYLTEVDRSDGPPYQYRSERRLAFSTTPGDQTHYEPQVEHWLGAAIYLPDDWTGPGRRSNGNGGDYLFFQGHDAGDPDTSVRGPPWSLQFWQSNQGDSEGDVVRIEVVHKQDDQHLRPPDYIFDQDGRDNESDPDGFGFVWSPNSNSINGARPDIKSFRGEWLRFVIMHRYDYRNQTVGYMAAWMTAPGFQDALLYDSRPGRQSPTGVTYNTGNFGLGFGPTINRGSVISCLVNYWGSGSANTAFFPTEGGQLIAQHAVSMIRLSDPYSNATDAGPGDPEYEEVKPPDIGAPPPPPSSDSAAPMVVEQGVLA